MRKALCVGIDNYQYLRDLDGCVNDANDVKNVLARNGDGTLNFDVRILSATSESSYITCSNLKDEISELFSSESDIALFYFAGHGEFDDQGGYLCTCDTEKGRDGLSLEYLMNCAASSKAKNKVIILDSCYSGNIGEIAPISNFTVLSKGTTILAACEKWETAREIGGHGVFTDLLVEALNGGAMNLLGEVSPGSIYAYIDRSLGSWEQRPVFKANIQSFVSLRKNPPPISITDLRKIIEVFSNPSEEYALDPTYEPDKHEADTDEVNKEHEAIFALLQKYVKLNLVVPVGEEHMYYAAIHRKSCKLTVQGQHYWNLAKKERI